MPQDFQNTTLDESEVSNTEMLYRAAIGPVSTGYYAKRFLALEQATRFRPSWNWAAALLTLNWMVFRKLWSVALVYAGVVMVLALALFGIGRLVFQLSDTTELALAVLLAAVSMVVPGTLGNHWLHAACRKKIDSALANHAELADACAFLERHASKRKHMGLLAAANVALLGMGAAGYQALPGADALVVPPQIASENRNLVVGKTQDATTPPPVITPDTAPPAAGASAPATEPTAPASAAASTTHPAAATPPIATSAASAASAPSAATASPSAATTPAAAASAAVQDAPPHKPAATAHTAASAPHTAAPTATGKQTQAAAHAAPAEPAAPPSAKVAVAAKAAKAAPASATPAKAPSAAKHSAAASEHSSHASGDTAKKKPHAAAASAHAASATAKEPSFAINVGLFADENNARNAYAKLQDANLPATQQVIKTKKGPMTRVWVGPFETQAEADRAAEKIQSLGLEAVVFTPAK
jgi:SPOR domain/Protein of unknown function (DUF2628)